eukprot:4642297-Amphidinium_carterae.1
MDLHMQLVPIELGLLKKLAKKMRVLRKGTVTIPLCFAGNLNLCCNSATLQQRAFSPFKLQVPQVQAQVLAAPVVQVTAESSPTPPL